ncbi:MAG TPA: FAD-binding oxidoreductase [Acidimicrobiales bacterium]|nr:FAD-binding oxidoreductase [Acidimicrobiales bacterium]
MTERKRSWWGWGWDDEAITGDTLHAVASTVAERLGTGPLDVREPADLAGLDLRAPRLKAPAALTDICSTTVEDRASHTYGKSYRDIVRGFHGDLPHPPDLVAFPRDESEVVALLDWCTDEGIAAVPFGGGSSVVGGVECEVGEAYAGAVSIDLSRLDRVLEIDRTSRAGRFQAGIFGPALEDALRPQGLTLRHFPQSFEFSTVGGWIVTRSGGHYASNLTHIDDFVESIRVVTPAGITESRRLPGSGAGPSPDRLFLGSEGSLGIVTEAWLRLQDRPAHKASAGARFSTMAAAITATRALAQSGLLPTNCRLLDPGEAAGSAGVTDGSALLVIGFESADHPVDAWMARAVELVHDHGGTIPEGVRTSSNEGSAGAWRGSFIRAPYGRDALVRMGVLAETFETACTWDKAEALIDGITTSVASALKSLVGGGTITCRFTHVYADGCAPYFTVMAPSRFGSEVQIWDDVKAAAGEAILAHGGTITHHHAVGRDHRPWYDRQRPDLFATALSAAKHALDPAGIMNPGVLLPHP